MNSTMNKRTAIGQVTLGAVLISFSAPFVGLAEVSASTSAFYRMAFGAAGLWVLLLVTPGWRRNFSENISNGWLASLLIAGFFALDLWLWHRSIQWIGPGLATLLANFQVFVMTLAGLILFGERPGWRFMTGLLLALTGLWLLIVQHWPGLDVQQRWGVVFGLLTALAYTGYMLSLRHSQSGDKKLSGVLRLFQVSICTTVLMAILNLLEGHSFVIPDARNLWILIGYGLLCQVLGWLMITQGLPGIAAGLAGLLLLLQPTLSVTWDMLFFDLKLGAWQWFGLLLALAGIYFGSLRGFRRNRKPAA